MTTMNGFRAHSAASALPAMNKRNCLGKVSIFVGDLASDIDQHTLRDAFASYGEISYVKTLSSERSVCR